MKKIVLVILLVLVTAGIGLLLYMLLTRTTPVYAGSSREIISDGSNFAVSEAIIRGLTRQRSTLPCLMCRTALRAH